MLPSLQLTGLVEHLLREENNSRILKCMFLGLVIFCLILIGATTGLTYAMVYALKDTKVGARWTAATDQVRLHYLLCLYAGMCMRHDIAQQHVSACRLRFTRNWMRIPGQDSRSRQCCTCAFGAFVPYWY